MQWIFFTELALI